MPIIHCYLCDCPFTPENRSTEHIILNSIGGRLKSDRLLCKTCNSRLGHKSDAELAKQFAFLAAYLQISRENGEFPIIKGGKTADGTEYHLLQGTKPSLARPVYRLIQTENGAQYSITARSEKEMHQMLLGIKKKYSFFDVEEAMRHAKLKTERMKEPISYEQTFGGTLAFQSILKTAINFYMLHNGDRKIVEPLFNMMLGRDNLDIVKHYHPRKPLYKKEPNEVIHLLHIHGNKHSRLLYCYIEFFSIHSFLVVLSTEYSGQNFSKTYAYDLITNSLLQKVVTLKLNRDEVLAMPTRFTDFAIVEEKSNRVMKIGDKIQGNKEIDNILKRATDDILVKKFGHEQRFTKQIITEFTDQVVTDFVEFLFGRAIH